MPNLGERTRTIPARAYSAGLVLTAALDLFWVGLAAQPFYRARVGHLMAPEARWLGAVLFYLLYPAGVLHFAARSPRPAVDGALLGLLVYGTYNFTNLALLRGWPLSVVAVDVAWGCVLTAVIASAQARLAGG